MERIHYAGGTIVTGTDISRALLDYAAVLARNEASTTIDVPVRDEEGHRTHANLLIGPASQLISVTEPSDLEEIVDEELVAELRAKTERLGPPRAIADGKLFNDDDDEFEAPYLGQVE